MHVKPGFVTPAFQKSSGDGAEQTAQCAPQQARLRPVLRTPCRPHRILEMGGRAVSVSGNGDSPAGPGSSPDGCCRVLTFSRGFQGIRVIKHNCGRATFNSVFPSPLSRYLRKKSVMSSDVLGKFFPSWWKDDLLKGRNRFRKSKLSSVWTL